MQEKYRQDLRARLKFYCQFTFSFAQWSVLCRRTSPATFALWYVLFILAIMDKLVENKRLVDSHWLVREGCNSRRYTSRSSSPRAPGNEEPVPFLLTFSPHGRPHLCAFVSDSYTGVLVDRLARQRQASERLVSGFFLQTSVVFFMCCRLP